MKTQRWYNILTAWQNDSSGGIASASLVIPYASPNKNEWHEGIYDFVPLCEVALGLRKEVTKEEMEKQAAYHEAEEALIRGDRNWMRNLHPDFDSRVLDKVVESAKIDMDEDEDSDDEEEDSLPMISGSDEFYALLRQHREINDED